MTSVAYAIDHFTDPERRVFRPRERISVSQWAEKYRMVVRGPAQGKWRNEVTPYCIEPMDTIALPWVRKVFLCWAPQTGKTSVGLNFMLYAIDVDPGPAMYVMPDEKVSKRIAKRQLIPTIRSTPKTAALLSSRIDDVTTMHVNFVNGMDLMMVWATSAAAMASESVRYILWDEPGKYPDFVGDEADPFSLGDVRTNSYQYTSKQIFYSTPKLDGDAFDRLIRSEAEETRRYHAKCPICGHLQIMGFERIHWHGKRDHREVLRGKLARYSCAHCGMDWDDHARNVAVRGGRWKAETPVERPTAIAFGPLESWYSPFVSLSKAAADFLKGKDDPKKLQAFVTQHQARPWKEVVESKAEGDLFKRKTDLPPGICPSWTVALTAGIDVQKRGFWFVVRAWGEDLTSHLVQYGYLSTFDDVRALVFDTYFHKDGTGERLQIWRAAMDTGGGKGADDEAISRTEEIYEFIRAHGRRDARQVIFAVKGSSRPQLIRVNYPQAIDRMPRSNKPIPGGIELRMLDTGELKKLLHWRLTRRDQKVDENGNVIAAESQRFFLHAETGVDYTKQFLAEELRRTRKGRIEWVKTRSDNHLLDCEIYAAACADNGWHPNLSGLARYVKAKEGDLQRQSAKSVANENEKPKTPAQQLVEKRVVTRRRVAGTWMGGI
ncbi:MAG: phage terminase large subunit family protein [Desulfobacterales bacterium]|jgi:phage terminase large subunit GpA-like protein|nr:phage terminase large subunit family protein [Desulfobacterales bacterium]MCU0601301.1 phage terminase large subunit family protein [Desulfobacterales bacterium]